MKTRKIATWMMLFCGVAIFLSAAQLASGQSEDGEKQVLGTQDSSSEAAISAKVQQNEAGERAQGLLHSPDSTYEGTGWLILEGRYIPGPYNFSVSGDTLFVNGIPVNHPRRTPRRPLPENPPVGPAPDSLHELNKAFWKNLRTWYSESGFETARMKGVEFLEASSLVESARIDSGGDITAKYVGRPGEETFYLHTLFDPDQEHIADLLTPEATTARLERRAANLTAELNKGALVITVGPQRRTLAPPKAEQVFIEIQRIIDSIPEIEGRKEALRTIIPNDRIRTAIAEKFDQ